MTTRRFLLVATVTLILAATCLALAAVLRDDRLAVAGTGLVLVPFVARELWIRRREPRPWANLIGGLLAVVAVAFVLQLLIG